MDGYSSNGIVNRPTAAVTAFAATVTLVILITLPRISCSGSFQIFLSSYLNDRGLAADGNCCHGSRRLGSNCGSNCSTFFRICLSHFQSSLSSSFSSSSSVSSSSLASSCSFGNWTTPVLGENSFRVPEVLGTFTNPINISFRFTWPGSFSLSIEAWHDSGRSFLMAPHAHPENRTQKLISRLSFQQNLEPNDGWQRIKESNGSHLDFRFRVVCSRNYYGSSCTEVCNPRNDVFGHYNCSNQGAKICLEGWKGEYCNIAKCSPECHEIHGFCESPNQCKCNFGWKGERCDMCIEHPGCEHGSCVEPFTCNCHPGWGGILCNQDLNFCGSHSPCQNGATCINAGQGSYACLCPTGLTGANCELDTGDCRAGHLSCQNDGSCLLSKDSGVYECLCSLHFHGRRCEVTSGPYGTLPPTPVTCSDHPCRHGGVCSSVEQQAGSLGYRCSCLEGFSGNNCELVTDHCLSHPCLNDGKCIRELNDFRCICQTGYDGDRCQYDRMLCSGNPCLNGGSCSDESSNIRCTCRPPFTGKFCQFQSRNCTHSPCAAGSTCIDLPFGYRCLCPDDLSGRHCSVKVNPCTSRPCLNGGTCFESRTTHYGCSCQSGYTGPLCDIIDDAVTGRNNSGTTNNTSIAPRYVILQLTLIVSLGAGIPLIILTVSVVVLVLRRKRKERRRRTDTNNEELTRCLNNQSVPPLETISLKTVSEQKKSLLLNPSRDEKNSRMQSEIERLQRKSKNFNDNSVVNF